MTTAHDRHNTVALFREAMADAGIVYSGKVISDGLLHRFSPDSDNKRKASCWYVLHDDSLPAGAFGCWQCGINKVWSAKSVLQYTPQELEQHRQRVALMCQQRKQEQHQREQEAKQKALKLWSAAHKPKTSKEHFYTAAKQVQPFGVRVLREMLLVPVYSPACELVGLQVISQSDNGETLKRFITGTPTRGNYCPIGRPSNNCSTIAIGEGWATMASVHTATGWPCVAALSANNLEAVARVMRDKFPAMKLVICADDDRKTANKTGKNPGIEAAQTAANAVGGFVALPLIGEWV